jgi:hypothetical protein
MTILETTFTRTPIDLPTVRDAARRKLSAQGTSATEDLPAAIFARLAAAEPVSSPLLFFAVRACESPLSAGAERRIELPLATQIEARFHAEVEEFCSKFFELEPSPRRTRCSDLLQQTSASPALTARLDGLWHGLDVEFWKLSDERPAVQRVAALLREFFVMPPPERAIKRREWLAAHAAEAKRLRRAAAQVAECYPKVAELDPVLIQCLCIPARRRYRRSRVQITLARMDETPHHRFLRVTGRIMQWAIFAMFGLCLLVVLIPLFLPWRSAPPSGSKLAAPDGFIWPDNPNLPTSPLNVQPANRPQSSPAPPPVKKKVGGGL